MASPKSIYADKIDRFEQQLKQIKKKLLASSMLRLLVFLLIIVVVYFLWGNFRWLIAGVLLGLVLFFYLISRHVNLQQKRDKLKALIGINQTEIKVLEGEFSQLADGEKYKNSTHDFSRDIDIFGERSFFQYLNRTALKEGEQKLADKLTENRTDHIERRQETLAELGEKIDFRQEFSALAQLTAKDRIKDPYSIKAILESLKGHQFFTPKYAKTLSTVFSLLSIGVILVYFFGLISLANLALWLIVGIGISSFYIKKVNALSAQVGKMQMVFRQYHQLLALLEDTSFSSELMRDYQTKIASKEKKASAILYEFSQAISALDQRNNLLFGFLGNGFLLWDLRQSHRIEKWMKAYTEEVDNWFEVVALIDANNSLGNFVFNHPTYTFPKITDSKALVKAKAAVHPLIPESEAVVNDFQIDKGQFFIITGANMAGKSTFLRTVALQIVMSNVGLPVCAAACEYSPIKLITSMRTVDSLAEEASYFYAELSRLKLIIDQLKKEEYFIVLDEILKGTNSTDKAIGSQKFLEKLVRSHSTGIIATHDLSLCKVAENLPEVKNYYFDAQIINDELYFDYTFKTGVCQNMNASFLLKKMEIVD